MVSRLMEGLKETSSATGNEGGGAAAAFFTSTAAGVFCSEKLLASVTASGSSSGFGSGKGCALSERKKTETYLSDAWGRVVTRVLLILCSHQFCLSI